MKSMGKFKNKQLTGLFGIFFIILIFFASCIKDNTSSLETESKVKYEKLKADFGMTKKDSIGYGVYRQFVQGEAQIDTIRPVSTDYALISYSGYMSDGSLIETSDSAIAKQGNIYYNDLVYGPTKIRVGNTIAGIYLALLNMPVNSKAVIVMPSEMAYGNYEPVRYTITLHKVIKNEIKYEKDQRLAYIDSTHFQGSYNSDSTLYFDTNKFDSVGQLVKFKSKVTIKLRANYVEWERDAKLNKNPGRQFFPINNSSDTLRYYYHYSTGFPLTPAIDSLVAYLKIGEEGDFIASSDYVYGETGFLNLNFNIYLVPRYTSVHYKIKLLKVE
jgi:FKBP-type peptidyl-prolyl cis-trans isomerase 2